MSKAGMHPFEGEGFDEARAIRFWDDFADDYSSRQQGNMPQRIVDRLAERGIIHENASVLELGCGPGTYSFPLAEVCGSILCVDSSKRMLERLTSDPRYDAWGNMSAELRDFKTLSPKDKYHTTVSSMCPGLGDARNISKIESFTDKHCAAIVWLENAWDNVHAEMWGDLGKDYSFEGRRENAISKALESLNREFTQETFECDIAMECPLEELIMGEVAGFKRYGLGDDVGPSVRKVLEKHAENGVYKKSHRNSIILTTWEVGRS